MKDVDTEIRKHRAALTRLQDIKRKSKKRRTTVKSSGKRGRPHIEQVRIDAARELAREFPIADVAFKMDIGRTTLFDHGITREKLEREKLELSLSAAAV